jgi:single-strand DNA-binding protein
MSNLSVEGKVKRIHDEQVISDRFKKREFVIETEEQYPQVLMFQLVQDKTNLVDQFSTGDKVEVFFNLRGREWQKDPSAEVKVFNTLDAWRIQKVEVTQPTDMPSAEPVAPASPEDDLPF